MSENLSASADGKRNAHSFHCDVTANMQQYAVCLSKAERLKQGTLNLALHAACVSAIQNNTCPAQAMRTKEIEAGHAIYFKQRTGGPITSTPAAPRAWSGSEPIGLRPVYVSPGQSPVRHAPKPAPAPLRSTHTDYADLINQKMKELKK